MTDAPQVAVVLVVIAVVAGGSMISWIRLFRGAARAERESGGGE